MGEVCATERCAVRCDEKETLKRHISELPFAWSNWYKHINWLNTNTVITLPILGFIGACYTPLTKPTFICAVLYYFITGMGITAGYHRLWAHRSYSASFPLQVWLAAVGAGALENSIRRWSRDHRAHHRFTDTDKDPYSVRKGLLYSHIGWLILLQDPKRLGRSDISDLNADQVVVFQHKHYLAAALFMGLIFPSAVCGVLFNDWRGGLIYAGIIRIFFVQQATFCVNSVAHWLGAQPFDDRNSPKDHALTAVLTLGEGYHNFHHEFPCDYRNAIQWHQYDPTKWSIRLWKQLGLAHDLKTFRQNEIDKGRYQQEQKALDRAQRALAWPSALEVLPLLEWEEFRRRAAAGDPLVVIAGVVHDVGAFMEDHPGGRSMIRNGIGTDATASFNGGVYYHSKAARRVLSGLRIGVLRGGCEIEVLKEGAGVRARMGWVGMEGRNTLRA